MLEKTRTATGLGVVVEVLEKVYQTGRKYAEGFKKEMKIVFDEYLPKIRAALTEATKVVASGKLTLPISAIYKPSQIKEAIEHAQRGGKVLLDFNH